jgi:TrmH family RNA methyltransferase
MQPATDNSGRADWLITSLDNPTIRFARNLQRRRFRYHEHALLVEGVRAITTANTHGAEIRSLLIDARRAESLDPVQLEALTAAATRVLYVAGEPFDSVVDTEHPQPIAAICTMPAFEPPLHADLVLALDGIRDPGNLGTLIRTAAAAGADAVALLPECVDPFNAKTVRASAGLVFAIPVVRIANLDALITACFETRPLVAVASAGGVHAWDAVDWTQPTIVVLGGETAGVSNEVRTYADLEVTIPMATGVDSLNVAAAGAALLFEVQRQRRVRQ